MMLFRNELDSMGPAGERSNMLFGDYTKDGHTGKNNNGLILFPSFIKVFQADFWMS